MCNVSFVPIVFLLDVKNVPIDFFSCRFCPNRLVQTIFSAVFYWDKTDILPSCQKCPNTVCCIHLWPVRADFIFLQRFVANCTSGFLTVPKKMICQICPNQNFGNVRNVPIKSSPDVSFVPIALLRACHFCTSPGAFLCHNCTNNGPSGMSYLYQYVRFRMSVLSQCFCENVLSDLFCALFLMSDLSQCAASFCAHFARFYVKNVPINRIFMSSVSQ